MRKHVHIYIYIYTHTTYLNICIERERHRYPRQADHRHRLHDPLYGCRGLHIYIYICIYIYIYIYVYVYICYNACMYACIYIYIYIYTHTYTFLYMYMHTFISYTNNTNVCNSTCSWLLANCLSASSSCASAWWPRFRAMLTIPCRCTHGLLRIRRQRGHPGVVLPLVISNSASHWEGM